MWRHASTRLVRHRRRVTMMTPFRSTSTIPDASTFYTPEQKAVMETCHQLRREILMPLNDKMSGLLHTAQDAQPTALPAVLLVGNHSSGKSSFLNYLVGRQVQHAGVAPTDDAFTVLVPGQADRNQDGLAVAGDPDLGFAGLRQFGPTLLHHLQLKIRTGIHQPFFVIDTPGMIDSPGTSNNTNDRGYDFVGVVRWLAARADVVCLFFDPDKPGTTGETLQVFTQALSDMDHKLLIIFNKADQLERVPDLARAYGALCWNLSKVIPRKDLPRIYTMSVPRGPDDSANNSNENKLYLQHDLDLARQEVVDLIHQAPLRRVDNVVTELYDQARLLLLHGTIVQELQRRRRRLQMTQLQHAALWATLGTTGTVGLAQLGMVGSGPVAAMAVATLLTTAGTAAYHQMNLNRWMADLAAAETQSAFVSTHAAALEAGDEYTAALWKRWRTLQQQEFSETGLPPAPSSADLRQLQDLLDEQIPALRRRIAPGHLGKDE